jgi:hypothetical protein
MIRKSFLLISVAAVIGIAGCVKETYDMSTLSKWAHISPTFAISAVRGNISLSDLKNIPNDTVIFDEDKFIRIVFTDDSILDYNIDEYDDFKDLAEFHLSETYSVVGGSINDIKDTVTFEPGNDIEIVRIVINTGSVNYKVKSKSAANASFTITLPSVLRGATPVTQVISIPANSTVTGSVSINNTDVDLTKDPEMVYNRLPVSYSISATSGIFGLNDSMIVQLDIPSPDFDYIKGYFGQQTKPIDADSIDLDIKELLNHITGDFLLSSPSLTLKYQNSFAIPLRIDLQATGYKETETVPLNMAPFGLSMPKAPAQRDKDTLFTINKDNSDLPELVSMPPEKIRFSGSMVMNPLGNTGSRNNYLFGNSRFHSDLEIEVPLEFRIDDLQFTDTTKNFLQLKDSSDSPLNPEDFEFLRIDIDAENGFPLGVSLSMILFDTLTMQNVDTIDAGALLEPASVDANGRVTQPRTCSASIDIDRHFWESTDIADKIIFSFTLNTTDGGTKDVKIYSDYAIDFKAALVLKPDIRFNLK